MPSKPGKWLVGVRAFVCIATVVLSCVARAQSVAPEDEYKKLIRVSEDIQPLGEHPFGENISLYDGSLSFTQTDVSLRGNGPVLELVRQFKVEDDTSERMDRLSYPFGDWDIAIPHLETVTPASGYYFNSTTNSWLTVNGWMISNEKVDPNTRCSNFGPPLPVVSHAGDSALEPWDPYTYWHGYHLVMPGQGNQDILANDDAATQGTYPAVTKSHWRFSCLGSTANGAPGEGFLAQAPDGTKYWFDELVYRNTVSVQRPLYTLSHVPKQKIGFFASLFTSRDDFVEKAVSLLVGAQNAYALPTTDILKRQTAWLLVTKIQDRFGNTLTFSYDSNGLLTGISASDGRSLTVQYVSGTVRIQSVTLQPSSGAPRTWSYGYGTDSVAEPILTSVTLPDGNQWQYSLGNFDTTTLAHQTPGTCTAVATPSNMSPATGTITHPSGLTGQFTVQPIKRGRSFVPRSCEYYDNGLGSYADIPDAWYNLSVTQETTTGAGIPTQTWSYGYSPSAENWSDCTGTCPTTAYTDVTNPDGSTVRHTFSNRYDYSESQLLQEDYYTGAVTGTPIRSVTYNYALPTTSPLPAFAGTNYQEYVNQDQTTKYSPMNSRVTAQDGDRYTWQAEAFDVYENVTKTKRFSSVAGQGAIEEQTSYLNDTSLWVLGLPQTVTNLTTGEIETNNTYNSLDLLQSRSRFGEFMMSYTYDSAGQLASFTDGNNHTTTLGNYYRGIPQSIGFPDNTSQTLVVDDFGQITSITDQASHTTHYGYDAMGRIREIDYPTGDSVAWYSKQFVYDYVPTAERGVAAGHWRRTTTLGNAKTLTYFDAELRPVLSDVSNGSDHTTTATAYDWKGQTAFASYPVSGQPDVSSVTTGTHHTYDTLGRLTQTQEDSELGTLTTVTTYPGNASEQVTDPRGNVTTTHYQVFDEPAYKDPILVSAPAGITQSITRDIYGSPLAITQSGAYGSENDSVTKTLIYDAYHRLCRTTEPESGSTVMAYDSANNLAWSAQGLSITGGGCGQEQVATASQTARTYDAMNRVLTITPPSGTQSTTYIYDAVGNIKTSVSGIATQFFVYNTRNLLTAQGLAVAGTNYNWGIGYVYDGYGHLSAVGYPAFSYAPAEGVAYNPDALGRATQVGSYASGVSYFPNGQVAGFNYGNGVTYVAQQNARQLLSNFSYGAGSTLNVSEDFSYDANGNITNVSDLVNGQRTKAFGYDALNRLTSATATNLYGTENYTYDALNNLRSRLTGGNTLTFNYDAANRLASVTQGVSTTTTYGYDAQGNRNNLSSGGATTQYNFDAENQLLQIPGLESYAYDAAGRRVVKTSSSGASTYYLYDQAGQLMYQYDPSTYIATNYIYLGTKLVAKHAVNTAKLSQSQVNVVLSLVGAPTLSADGTAINAVVDISNRGTATLSSSGPYPVHLGDHVIDSTGKVITFDLDRFSIPDIAPGSHAAVQVAVGAAQVLGNGNRIEFIPLQEGVAWFDSWGTTPLIIGPYSTCPTGGDLCNTASALTSSQVNVTLSLVGGPTLSADGQTVTATVDISNQGTVTLSSSGKYPVDLGDHFVDATGKILVNDITRAHIPDIAPGTHAAVAISVPSSGFLGTGQLLQFMPVQEGIAWFDSFGTKPVTAGPYVTPSSPVSSFTGSYAVSWGGIGGAASYTLQQQINGGSWTSIQSSSATSWAASGEGNATYAYRVQACGTSGCGPWSNTTTTGVLLPPASAPSPSVPGSSNNGSYTVSWNAIATATSYTLQEQINGGGWTTVQANGTTSWGASGRGNGTYGYRLQACNAAGCGSWSGTASIVVTLPPASAPSLSVPSSSSTGSYTVSWSGVNTATSYTLQEQVNGGGWTTVQANGATSWGTSGRGNGTYGYHVQACNVGGCGAWSGVAAVTVALPPPQPANATITDTLSSGGKVESYVLSWSAASTATRYEVQRTDGTGVYSGTALSVTLEYGPSPYDMQYNYQLRACNAAGCSAWVTSFAYH